jgi:hypothetical protein
MHFDGDFADGEFGSDLFVEETRDHQPHHLPLARREQSISLTQLGQARLLRARRAPPLVLSDPTSTSSDRVSLTVGSNRWTPAAAVLEEAWGDILCKK